MKKLIIGVACISFALVALFVSKNYTASKLISESNIESLTSPETLQRNFVRGDAWYPASGSITLTSTYTADPGYVMRLGMSMSYGCSVSWNCYVCCLNGTDMDGCDFSKEDSKCPSIVIRAQHQ